MRKILFRGKRIDNDEWVEGYYWCEYARRQNQHHIYTFEFGEDEEVIITGNVIVDPLTVGQFTGLLDKNGKKIFEGDIVRAKYKETYDDTYGECFPAGEWIGFVEYEEAKYIINTSQDYSPALCNICITEIEVIGTIYDKENT